MIESLALTGAGGFPAHDVDFTALDIRTTGLRPGHVIELAAVRVRADGAITGELATLIDPGRGISPGTTGAHGITRGELDGAPPFGAVLGRLLDLCLGSVVVAHNLPFVDGFLTSELARLGVRVPVQPGICTLAAAPRTVRLPNYRLATVARALGVAEQPAQPALAGARTIAGLVTTMVRTHGFTFAAPPSFPVLPKFAGAEKLRSRAVGPAAEPGWMAGVVERVQAGPLGGDPAVAQAYLDLLAGAVEDHHVSHGEVWALAALATEAGLAESDVRLMHEQFVAALRMVAEGDGVMTRDEARDLRQVATALGVADLVDDLAPIDDGHKPMRVLVLGTSAAADHLRARVLDEGVQLAKKLTASVTHVVHDATVPSTEPRLNRARELGADVVDVRSGPVALGFEPVPAQRTAILPPVTPAIPKGPAVYSSPSVPPPVTRRAAGIPVPPKRFNLIGGRVLIGFGLFWLFIVVLAMFGGSALGAGIAGAIFGLGFVFGGWWLTEGGRTSSP